MLNARPTERQTSKSNTTTRLKCVCELRWYTVKKHSRASVPWSCMHSWLLQPKSNDF